MNAITLSPRAQDAAGSIIASASRLNTILGTWTTPKALSSAYGAVADIRDLADRLEDELAGALADIARDA